MAFFIFWLCAPLLSIAHLAFAGPSTPHEKSDFSPDNWHRINRAPSSSRLNVRIVLADRNVGEGDRQLLDISDPQSPRFGQHWTADQVHKFFSPDLESVAAVQTWLSSAGISEDRQNLASSLSHVCFDANVGEAEKLLSTEYFVWQHESGVRTVACDRYFVPADVKDVVEFVTPGIGLYPGTKSSIWRRVEARGLPQDAALTSSANCSEQVTPACIREAYGIPIGNHSYGGNDLGMFEAGEGYNQDLLDTLFTNFAPFVPNGTHPIGNSIDGGPLAVPVIDAGPESMLDLEVAYPLTYPQAIRYLDVYSSRNPSSGYFDNFLDALDATFCTSPGANNSIDPHFPNKYWNHPAECGTFQPPNVISMSYSDNIAPFYPTAYRIRQCREYLKLGLQGVSIIAASGDSGAQPVSGGCSKKKPLITPFPSDCPYVLSVGATQLGITASSPEQAAYGDNGFFTSGGGFSSTFTRPSYQEAAVQHFFTVSTDLPHRPYYNKSNRGFPDISAVGQNILVYYGETKTGFRANLEDGTSASTPLVASLITRINGMRLAAGKKVLGFLNPIFYAHPEMFTDITQGLNNGCYSRSNNTQLIEGFHCVEGWDPVTGLGTPDYSKMVDYLTGLK